VFAQNYPTTNLIISSGNSISFRNLTLNTPGIVQFLIRNIILPDYTATLNKFTIRTSRNSYPMDEINNAFILKVSKGLITSSFTALSY
jgi:hypothetical protein